MNVRLPGSPTFRRIFLWTVLFGTATGIGNWLANVRNSEPASDCGLVVYPKDLDFGTVWWQPKFEWILPIVNPTDEKKEITRFHQSCDCVSVEPESIVIPAGMTKHVKLTLNLAPPADHLLSHRWTFSATLIPSILDMLPGTVKWLIQGEVRSAWVACPRTIDFGHVLGSGVRSASKLVQLACSPPVAKLEAESDESLANVRLEKQDAAGSRYKVEIRLQSLLPAGHHVFPVQFKGLSAENEKLAGVPLQVGVYVRGVVEAVPDILAFGARAIGETASETVVLHAPGGEDFSVIETTADSADVEIHQVVSDEFVRGDSVFLISQRIDEPGNHVSTVRFLVQVANVEAPINILVELSYFGLQ